MSPRTAVTTAIAAGLSSPALLMAWQGQITSDVLWQRLLIVVAASVIGVQLLFSFAFAAPPRTPARAESATPDAPPAEPSGAGFGDSSTAGLST